MPQIILHSPVIPNESIKKNMVHQIRESVYETLAIDAKAGQVFLYETSEFNRAIHPDRDQRLVFVEIHLYKGRSRELKHKLAESIISIIHRLLDLAPNEILCQFHEVLQENYYGGISHSYIENINL